jgi:hypothetical protein
MCDVIVEERQVMLLLEDWEHTGVEQRVSLDSLFSGT